MGLKWRSVYRWPCPRNASLRALSELNDSARADNKLISSTGDPHGMMDCIRHAGVETVMQTLIQDLRYSVRQLIKSPGFTLTAVISLALGIGATTAVFSVIYAALIDPYPFPAADRIVRMSVRTKAGSVETVNLNPAQIQQLRQVNVIENMLAMDYHAMTMTGRDLPENVNVIGLISNGFDDLGVPPLLGRGLLRSDAIDGQDPQPVAVVSYKFWQERLGGDPQLVGKALQLDRKNYTVVGVAAPRFRWYNADVYLPLKMTQDPGHFCIVDFRLRPGVKHQAADAALQPLLDQFARDMPKHFPEHFKVQVEGLNEWVERDMSGTLYLLLGAVGLLLAIGCGNVSILLLAQGTARQHEFAVRAAVGAQSRRIVRQLLTESMLLAAIGVVLGVLASYGILAGIKAVLPQVCLRAGGGDPHQSSGAGFQRRCGGGNGAAVRALAGDAFVANASGPDHGVEHAPRGGKRARTQSSQCADCPANCADAGAAGRGGLGDEGLLAIDAHAAGLRSSPRDVGGHSTARELVHHVGRARSIF